jgi:SPASM domain peptide maturase of grasp-with-spasm system
MAYNKHIFRLFAGCILQKGYNSYVICDLQRKRIRRIPKTLYYILEVFRDHSMADIKKSFRHQHDEAIDEYFDFLFENEFGFFCSRKQISLFPAIDLAYEHPSLISNAIIDIDRKSPFTLSHVLALLEDLYCRHIQLRFSDAYAPAELIAFLKIAGRHSLSSVDVAFNCPLSVNVQELRKIYSCSFVSQLHVFNVPATGMDALKELSEDDHIYFHTGSMFDSTGSMSMESMQLNIRLFSESQKHHTYFNRKLYIAADGELKNAPQCDESFGNVMEQDSLRKTIADVAFQKYWRLGKDRIDVCKDCEFRHTCIDSRLPKERIKGKWYHETECNYNPYISKWKGEEGYRTLQECGVKSGPGGFKIDRRKLNAVNRELWD